MERIETTILRNLVFNEEFARKTIPFIQPDFFEQRTDKILFEEIVSFITKYDSCLLYTSPSPRDATLSRMPSSA